MAITRTVDYADWHYDQEDFVLEDFSNGITGTTDPEFDVRANGLDAYFTYEGAFRMRYLGESDVNFSTRNISAMAYDSATNSIFVVQMNSSTLTVGQVSIPAVSTTEVTQDLSQATLLQDFVDFSSQLIYDSTSDDNRSASVGAAKIIGGDLFITTYYPYDVGSNENHDNLVVIRGIYDLSTATLQGFLDIPGGDKLTGYIFEIPAEHQSDFGSYQYGMGVGNPPSIASRWDFGHGFWGVSLQDISESIVTCGSTQYLGYTDTNPISGWSIYNNDVREHYISLFSPEGSDINDYLNRPVSEKMTFEQVRLLPRPDSSLFNNCSGWEVAAKEVFIPPNSDSLVLIGSVDGLEFGRSYTGWPLEQYSTSSNSSSPEPISDKDWCNVIWIFNLNDIKNATNIYDPAYCYFGEFYNRWKNYTDDDVEGIIDLATYDAASGKLLVSYKVDDPDSTTQTQRVIEVYSSVSGTGV